MTRKSLPYALAWFFIVAFQWMAMLFLPLFYSGRGVSEAGIGILISLFSLSTLLLVFPMGALADRLPPRPIMVAGAAVVGGASLYLPFSTGFAGLAVGTFLAGAGFTLSSISLYSLFFKQVAETRRGFEVSILNIGGLMGAGLGAWSCGEIMGALDRPWTLFALSGAFALAWALITAFLPKTGGISFPILEYGRDLRRGRTWLLIAIMFTAASHAGFEQAGYTLLQTEVIGLSPRTVGQIFLVLAVWMSIITFWTGGSHDRHQRPVLMMGLALIVSGLFMAASGSAGGAADFLVYRVLHTAGDSVTNLLTLVVASMIFPRKRAGGAFAFALTVNTASYFLFANLAGLVADSYGFDTSFHLSGAIEVAAGALLLAFRPGLRRHFGMD